MRVPLCYNRHNRFALRGWMPQWGHFEMDRIPGGQIL